jgi:hypothetical protein
VGREARQLGFDLLRQQLPALELRPAFLRRLELEQIVVYPLLLRIGI